MSFEARLADAFERYADLAPVAVEPSIAQLAVASAGPRRRAGMPGVLGRRTLVLAVLALMLLAALAAALVVGSLINRHMGLPGKFSDVGPSQIRYIAAAAGLDDGRVVVFGEARPTAPASTPDTLIELFDPATKTFKQLAAFPEPRNGFTATALRNGKVLIAGGDTTSPDGVSASMANAQLFDPVTGGLTATGSMSVGRTQHTAIRMADGRVLVIAGQSNLNGDDPFNYTAEIYDPASGAWSQAGTMTAHRSAFATTLLRDGRVLVAGGWDQVGGATDFGSVEVFDPATGYFVAVGDLLTVRRSPTAALLADGRVLLVGGYDGNTVVATAEVFDPATGRSTAAGSLLTERQNAVASTMTDGRVVVIGGSNLVGDPLSTEIYDPKSGTFAPGAFAAHEHGGPAIALPDGRILLTGATSEIYDPGATTEIALLVPRSDGMFRLTRAPVTDRTGHVATKLADGRVLLAGGLESRGARAQGYVALDSAEIYDPRSGTFAGTGALLVPGGSSDVTGKLGNDALSLDDGRALLLVQKHRHRMGPEWDLQAYDPATGRFSSQGTIESANEAEAPVRFLQQPDGHIVIVGASLTPSVTPTQDMSVFWIDWPTIQPTKIGTISGCGTVVAVQLASGDRIAVLCRPSGLSASVVLFDLASGATSWIAVPMSPGAAALVRLADGRLLAAGGSEPTTLSLVDPATATAMPAGIVDTAPASPASWPETANTSVTVLADGRVLILSGSKASVWDPATGTATSIPGPIASRDGHSATLLDDGQVLIFGGTTWAADKGIPPPPAVELFNPDAIP